MPPGDILPYMTQLVASLQNMTNVAILYDDSFGKVKPHDPHQKGLMASFMFRSGGQVPSFIQG
jgi:hypothetical protein